jgi:hypothetical protein
LRDLFGLRIPTDRPAWTKSIIALLLLSFLLGISTKEHTQTNETFVWARQIFDRLPKAKLNWANAIQTKDQGESCATCEPHPQVW